MYDTERNEENENRQKELYRAAFSGLHASEKLKKEGFYMKYQKSGAIRIGRMAFISMLLAVMLCMMAVMAYATTDGETVNPVTAIKLYIDGKDVSGQLEKQEDGSYTVNIDGENGAKARVEISKDAEKFSENPVRIDIETDEATDEVACIGYGLAVPSSSDDKDIQ